MTSPPSPRPLDRRTLLAGLGAGGAALIAACAPDPVAAPSGRGSPSARPTPSASPAPAPDPAPRVPRAAAWRPGPGEVQPEVKRAATRVVEALGTVRPGEPGPADRLRALGVDPALVDRLVDQAGPLLPPVAGGPATARVVYPQYGGLTASTSSVMAVVEQVWLPGPRAREVARRDVTVDVRLVRTGSGWVVTELRPVAPRRTTSRGRGDVRRLLGSDRVDLPAAARADLLGGGTDPLVVATMLGLAARHRFSVSVLRSGHPVNVFGTDGLSNHTRGRAVDVWAIDGDPVAAMAVDDRRLLSFLTTARELGSTEVGGPVDLDGGGSTHFADLLHRDHVHVGFD